MADPINIFIVGHDMQAKCKVANAVIKQEKGFRQFSCRQNLVIKKIVGTRASTLSGRTLNIALTPGLNTPAWNQIINGSLKHYNNKFFIYVKSSGGVVQVNDESSVKTIKDKLKVSNVMMVTYFQGQGRAKTSGINDIDAQMSFEERVAKVEKMLSAVGETLQNKGKCEIKSEDVETEERKEFPERLERQNTCEVDVQEDIGPKDWDLLDRTLRHGTAKSNHVRVNFIGNQGAGKTTLISRLHGLDVKCPDDEQNPTEALEIKELSSRCIEINGEKDWESNTEGYVVDLNIQRMAQAMKSVEKDVEGNVDNNVPDITEEAFGRSKDNAQSSGINVDKETEVESQDSYPAMTIEHSRVQYMQQVLRKKNHSRGERMYISYWDFAGQSTYYSTHQVFMSPSAVYVLVVDLSIDLNTKLSDRLTFRTGIISECSVAESLKFWISSIRAFASDKKGGNAPVLIVGTHIDKLKRIADKNNRKLKDEVTKRFNDVKEILKMSEVECIAIDNVEPDVSNLTELRNIILDLGLGVIDEEIPAQWIDLEHRIQEQKAKGTVIMTFQDLKKLDEDIDIPIKDNTRLEAFLGHQHNRGHLMFFLNNNLRELIVLEPEVLAKFLNNLMRSRDTNDQKNMTKNIAMYNHNGFINRDYVNEAALMMQKSSKVEVNVDEILQMLVHLSIIIPYNLGINDTRYLLPCLLSQKPLEKIKTTKTTKSFQVVLPNNHMPPTFYHILIGGLLNDWKPIEKNPECPEIYNLYACFLLGSDTHQIEIYWKESRVYIEIHDFSKKAVLTTDKIFEVLDIIEKRIVKMIQLFRHTNTNYEIRVLCPKHKYSYISLPKLKKDEETMCYQKKCEHAVTFEEIFDQKLPQKKKPECYTRKPSDKDLGRLARFLVRENASSLACRLNIDNGLVKADRAAQSNPDESCRRFIILDSWRKSNGSQTLGVLIGLLTVTQDYDKNKLENLLERRTEKRNYDIPDEKLDISPENKCDILAASDYVGALYPFLILELGLDFSDIEVVRENHNDLRTIIFTLLQQWRQQNPSECTTRTLLDTAYYVGIDTTEIQEKVMRS